MKTFDWKRDIILWILIAIPAVYLYSIWSTLPETVPTHFNASGEPDGYGHKSTLVYLILFLGLGVYLLMTIIPHIDPKKKLQQMGKKYHSLKFLMVLFMSLLSIFIVYSTKNGSMDGNSNVIFVIMGLFTTFLGNYFQSIKHNYFIGIRTPWTLESENVWKKTHRLAGRLWVPGGILLAILPFFIENKDTYMIFFGIIIGTITVIPLVYSYLEFQKEKSAE